jgi:beta-glucanase (GH16 family)
MKERTLKRRVLGWSGVLCAALLPACSKAPSPEGDEAKLGTVSEALTLAGGTYEIRNVNSSKCLDVADWSTVSGDNVQQWGCNATSPAANQRFVVTSLGNNEYTIVNVHSGLALEMGVNSVEPGATPCSVKLFADANYGGTSYCYSVGEFGSVPAGFNDVVSSVKVAAGHRVRLFADGALSGGTWTSGTSLTADASDADLTDNSFNNLTSSLIVMANLQQGAPLAGTPAHQKFKIEDASGTGQYTIKPVSNTTHCVDIDGSSTSDGANAQFWTCNGSNAQRFTFNTVTPGTTTSNTVRLNDDFSSYMTNGAADPAKLKSSGQYTWRDDTASAAVGCRFLDATGASGVGDILVPNAANPPDNKLILRADNTAVAGDGWRGDRSCRSGELRSTGLQYWYGNFEARMKVVPAAGSNPGGTTGFVLGLYMGQLTDPSTPTTSQTNHRTGLELTGLRLNNVEASVITNNSPECTTFHECVGNYVSSPNPSTTFTPTAWHDYKIEWRWHYVKYYVDGALVETIRRPRRSSAWDDPGHAPDDVTLHMSFTAPDHRVENSYGGKWLSTELAAANNHHAEIEWVKFTSCDNGPDCTLP